MILNGYSIYDSKAQYFSPPVFYKHEGDAKREFQHLANHKESQIGKYPTDFCLFVVAYFNDSDGKVTPCDRIINLGLAAEYVNKPEVNTGETSL